MPGTFELKASAQMVVGAAAVAAVALAAQHYYHYYHYEKVQFGKRTKGWWDWVVGESTGALNDSKDM